MEKFLQYNAGALFAGWTIGIFIVFVRVMLRYPPKLKRRKDNDESA